MTAATPAPPPLDDGLDRLLRRMRLPYMRRAAPDVLATAILATGVRTGSGAPLLRVLSHNSRSIPTSEASRVITGIYQSHQDSRRNSCNLLFRG